MRHIDDADRLTAEERYRELAEILARGYRRLVRSRPESMPNLDEEGGPVESDALYSQPPQSVHDVTARETESGGGS